MVPPRAPSFLPRHLRAHLRSGESAVSPPLATVRAPSLGPDELHSSRKLLVPKQCLLDAMRRVEPETVSEDADRCSNERDPSKRPLGSRYDDAVSTAAGCHSRREQKNERARHSASNTRAERAGVPVSP